MADITGKKPSEFSQATVEALRLKLNQIPVLTEYPTTDATKAGTRFIYNGNEWRYMTQAEIDSIGCTDIVEVGFPAPLIESYQLPESMTALRPIIFFNYLATFNASSGLQNGYIKTGDTTFDFLGFGLHVTKAPVLAFGGQVKVDIFKNAHLLLSLENKGTGRNALVFSTCDLTKETIDSLFTQLPTTVRVATIDISGNPGSGTCDVTIATAKGYIVKTT